MPTGMFLGMAIPTQIARCFLLFGTGDFLFLILPTFSIPRYQEPNKEPETYQEKDARNHNKIYEIIVISFIPCATPSIFDTSAISVISVIV